MPVGETSILLTCPLSGDSSSGAFYLLDPAPIRRALQENGYTPHPWLDRCNSFTQVRGKNSSVGYVLVPYEFFKKIDTSKLEISLEFTDDVGGPYIDKLMIDACISVTGTVIDANVDSPSRADTDVVILRLVDARAGLKFYNVYNHYNVTTWFDKSTVSYYDSSKKAGTAYTWTTLIQDIWSKLPSAEVGEINLDGASFPSAPPQNFIFDGVGAWDALHTVLDSIDHFIVKFLNGTFGVVSFNATDNTNKAEAKVLRERIDLPSFPKVPDRAQVPYAFDVFHPHNYEAFQLSTDSKVLTFNDAWRHKESPVKHTVNLRDIAGFGAITITLTNVETIWSTLQAQYDYAGTIQNDAALTTDAEERAKLRANKLYKSNVLYDVYNGLSMVEPYIYASSVTWADFGTGDGMKTIIKCGRQTHPDPNVDNFLSPEDSEDWPGPPKLLPQHYPYEQVCFVKLVSLLPQGGSTTAKVQWGNATTDPTKVTWTEYDRTITVYDPYNIGTVDANTYCLCMTHRQTGIWMVVSSNCSDKVVRFKLAADLDVQGTADAVLLNWDGAAYVEGDAIKVCDWYAIRGMWQAKSGYRGIALYRGPESSSSSAKRVYDIVWMETVAWDLEGTLNANLVSGGSSVTPSWTFEQGNAPTSTVTVGDAQSFFPHSLNTGKVKAWRSEYEGAQQIYRVVNAQQMILYGMATINEPQSDPEVVLNNVTITWIKGWTFSPFNQEPNPVPVTAANPFKLKVKDGEKGFIVWREDTSEWVLVATAPPDALRVIHFELTEDLYVGGTASAKMLIPAGAGIFNAGVAITVDDWFGHIGTHRGMWQARSGCRGIALQQVTNNYSIVWLETTAWTIESSIEQDLHSTSADPFAAATEVTLNFTDTEEFEQGNQPATNSIVIDENNFFPHSLSTALVKGIRDEFRADDGKDVYHIMNIQQMVLYGTATLDYDQCASSTFTCTWERGYSFSPFNQEPNPKPYTCLNPFGLAGKTGDKIFLVYSQKESAWVAVQITHHVRQVISDLRLVGYTIQKQQGNIYVPLCADPTWVDWITGVSCSGS